MQEGLASVDFKVTSMGRGVSVRACACVPQPPFYSKNLKQMYESILHQPLQLRPCTTNAAISVLEGLLHKDPHQRLGATSDIVRTLRHCNRPFHVIRLGVFCQMDLGSSHGYLTGRSTKMFMPVNFINMLARRGKMAQWLVHCAMNPDMANTSGG